MVEVEGLLGTVGPSPSLTDEPKLCRRTPIICGTTSIGFGARSTHDWRAAFATLAIPRSEKGVQLLLLRHNHHSRFLRPPGPVHAMECLAQCAEEYLGRPLPRVEDYLSALPEDLL